MKSKTTGGHFDGYIPGSPPVNKDACIYWRREACAERGKCDCATITAKHSEFQEHIQDMLQGWGAVERDYTSEELEELKLKYGSDERLSEWELQDEEKYSKEHVIFHVLFDGSGKLRDMKTGDLSQAARVEHNWLRECAEGDGWHLDVGQSLMQYIRKSYLSRLCDLSAWARDMWVYNIELFLWAARYRRLPKRLDESQGAAFGYPPEVEKEVSDLFSPKPKPKQKKKAKKRGKCFGKNKRRRK